MKIKGYHNMYLLKVVQGIGLVTIVFGIWFTPYLLEAVIATFLLSVVGTSIAQHRYFGHRTFTTNRVTNFILALLATLSTSGSIIHWSAIHRHHHAHSDTEHDIHSPRHIGFIRCFFNWFEQSDIDKVKRGLVKDLMRNQLVVWFHNWYWPTIGAYVLLLGLIDPWLIISCWLIPIGWWRITGGVTNSFTHGYVGYKNFPTGRDMTTNSFWINLFCFGDGLHENHHHKPASYTFAYTNRWHEFDPCAWIIRCIGTVKA